MLHIAPSGGSGSVFAAQVPLQQLPGRYSQSASVLQKSRAGEPPAPAAPPWPPVPSTPDPPPCPAVPNPAWPPCPLVPTWPALPPVPALPVVVLLPPEPAVPLEPPSDFTSETEPHADTVPSARMISVTCPRRCLDARMVPSYRKEGAIGTARTPNGAPGERSQDRAGDLRLLTNS